jgi:hypothetical protein
MYTISKDEALHLESTKTVISIFFHAFLQTLLLLPESQIHAIWHTRAINSLQYKFHVC